MAKVDLGSVIGPQGPKGDKGDPGEVTLEEFYKAFPTDTASGTVASFLDGADGIPLKSCIVQIEPVQEGTGDPSPDNVRPISGWTGAKVTRTGKNLLPISTVRHREINYSDGFYNVRFTAVSTTERRLFGNWGIANAVSLGLAGGTYIWHGEYVSINGGAVCSTNIRVSPHGKEKYEVWAPNTARVINDDDKFFILLYFGSANTTYDCKVGIQIELGSTATDYEPYQGETYDITFPSEAGTVYGGSLDVSNGVLTVDKAQIASYNGETLPGKWISDRDVYAAGASPTTGAQVVYELATPVTYHLTPQEIITLLGQNNIWADTGDTSVTYRADTKLYIDKMHPAPELE